ncbi:unnamed protein product [Auanema sp. JU1783]|nr:unnamed protein product [Auanema sp. JU1783]
MVGLTSKEQEAVDRVIQAIGASNEPYCDHAYNVHRWITAWQDETKAAENLQRHLHIRKIMPLPPDEDSVSKLMEEYAPITILGKNRKDDNKILLLEQSGRIDISGLVENIQLSSFMRTKFRMMQRLQEKVEEEEVRTGEQSGGVLIMDLRGLSFSTNLLSVLAGPYRIMWGTLFEQYPQLIQQIIIINAPKFMNLLYQTCLPFIPADYRQKIQISSDISALHSSVDLDCIPDEYGGDAKALDKFEIVYEIKIPVHPVPAKEPIKQSLNTLQIPAGGYMVEQYEWGKEEIMDFYLSNEQNFTYFIFYSEEPTEDQTEWKEIYAGCERPALKQIDNWRWKTPHYGYYYIRYGNERAWMFSVTVQKAIYAITHAGLKPQTPTKVFRI